MNRFALAAWVLLGLTTWDAGVLAQQPAGEGPVSDPTRAGPTLKAVLEGLARPVDRAPGAPNTRLPQLSLAARLKRVGQPPVALLRVGDQLYQVSEGSRLSYVQPDGEVLALEVTGLDEQAVQIRVQPSGRVLTLR